jgi:hypothetical protein
MVTDHLEGSKMVATAAAVATGIDPVETPAIPLLSALGQPTAALAPGAETKALTGHEATPEGHAEEVVKEPEKEGEEDENNEQARLLRKLIVVHFNFILSHTSPTWTKFLEKIC